MTAPTMHAARLHEPAPIATRPLVWEEAPRPVPGPGQILLEVVACGVCRSNLHMVEGDWVDGGVPAISPIIPGHEVTGRVVELGDGVEGFRVGDGVGVQPLWSTCGTCEFCTGGREQLCHERLITGEHVDGGYAEFMLAEAEHAYLVPETLDLAASAPLFCPGITAFGAVSKLDIGPGDTVAVLGLGGVGHMAVQFAALTGAEVVAVGRNAERLAVAAELGAARTVDSTDVEALTALEGTADAVILFADADAVVRQAMDLLAWGGTLVTGVPVTLHEHPFNTEKRVLPTLLGSRAQMREALRLAAEGKVRCVTDHLALPQANEALQTLASGAQRSRIVLVPEGAR